MKNVLTLLTVVALVASAIQSSAQNMNPAKKLSREVMQRVQMKKFGGFVKDMRQQTGKVVIVNAQTSAKAEWFDEIVSAFEKMLKIRVEVVPGKFDLYSPSVQGSASVFIIDEPKLPMSLVAPDAKWSLVNIAHLKTDKDAYFEARTKKMTTRAMGYLLGAADSQYPMCLTGFVNGPEGLDEFAHTSKLPMDIIVKMSKYAPKLGIIPYKITTYRHAVTEGWAAPPTNDYQKAIWDSIHTLPTKPIEIKPEIK